MRRYAAMCATLAIAAAMAFPSAARAGRDAEFSLTLGGSQIRVSDDPLNDQWGVRVEPGFSLIALEGGPRQLRIGAGVGFEYFAQDVEVDFFGTSRVNEELLIITPEVILSWRQPIGAGESWYVEPGVGVGAAIGIIDVIGTDSGAGYSVRPFVRAVSRATDGRPSCWNATATRIWWFAAM